MSSIEEIRTKMFDLIETVLFTISISDDENQCCKDDVQGEFSNDRPHLNIFEALFTGFSNFIFTESFRTCSCLKTEQSTILNKTKRNKSELLSDVYGKNKHENVVPQMNEDNHHQYQTQVDHHQCIPLFLCQSMKIDRKGQKTLPKPRSKRDSHVMEWSEESEEIYFDGLSNNNRREETSENRC